MSHIFGLEHSFGGIINQGLDLIGNIGGIMGSPYGTGFGAIPGGSPGFGADGGNGNGNGGAVVPYTGGSCGPRKRTTETCVVIDNATGQVISTKEVKHRRRRKRLATKSDIADLAALKSILGGGKALDAWIATRGGR